MSSILNYLVLFVQVGLMASGPRKRRLIDRDAEARPADAALWPMALAVRESGLSRSTLLDWERRYGFPSPARGANGDRLFSLDQIQRLRSIRRALEAGHAPEQIVPAPADDLHRARRAVVDRLTANDPAGLAALLQRALAEFGLGGFVRDFVARLNVDVGDAWMQGRLEVFQEHLYTEAVQGLLRRELHALPARGAQRPVVLLTTTGAELHGLGLLMAEAVLRLEGCRCISLGVQTPLWDVVRATSALAADVVALGCSGAVEPGRLAEDLTELRQKLPPNVELWSGGSASLPRRQSIQGVLSVPDLLHAVNAVAAWRARQPPRATDSGPSL
jgi:DNA-binding transcriptional MerR regulator/methylmalonyl-CoA mutase cobalamin-binding subunit